MNRFHLIDLQTFFLLLALCGDGFAETRHANRQQSTILTSEETLDSLRERERFTIQSR